MALENDTKITSNMRNYYFALFICCVMFIATSCGNQNNGNTNPSLPTKTVFTYDGGKIILNDKPQTASVNGVSGDWSYVEDKGRLNWPPQPYYFVYYGGSKTLIISEKRGAIYFGTEDEAVRDLNVNSKWHEYRRQRE